MPICIVSYSYTVIAPCTVLYDVPINVAYKTLSKYFIQVLSFVPLVHITQTATRVGPNYTLHSQNYLQNFATSASCLKFDVKIRQIHTARQKPAMKQEDPVRKFLQANAHFIRAIWCSLHFCLVWERRHHTYFLALHPAL